MGRFWKDVEIISMVMGELDRTCQIVRRCDALCVLEGEIVHNARNDFGSNTNVEKFHPGDLGRVSNDTFLHAFECDNYVLYTYEDLYVYIYIYIYTHPFNFDFLSICIHIYIYIILTYTFL